MIDLPAIAAAHGITASDLHTGLARSGWDVTAIEAVSRIDEGAFVARVVTGAAARIAEVHTKRAARETQAAAQRIARMTPAASTNPTMICAKCDGAGRLDYYRHIEAGVCFWCKGTGIIRARKGA